jgi:hypothetical protein
LCRRREEQGAMGQALVTGDPEDAAKVHRYLETGILMTPVLLTDTRRENSVNANA